MRPCVFAAFLCSASVTACAQRDEQPQQQPPAAAQTLAQRLIGSWAGQNETRGSMSFTFASDQTATWIVRLPAGPDTLEIDYGATERDGRLLVDVSGFQTGPLAGRVMYGLIEFDGKDTLRMDLEPGPPGDDEVRPADLTSQDVLTLVRAEPGRRR